MQSGKDRKSFSLTGTAPANTRSKIIASSRPKKSNIKTVKKSIQAITGLATDVLNTLVIASTIEGKLHVRLVCCFGKN